MPLPLRVFDYKISIHALREEGDITTPWTRKARTYFYPRPPRGGRPQATPSIIWVQGISIHALREEGDWRPP